jgi:tetratricopeptide (TPR) repeat protein
VWQGGLVRLPAWIDHPTDPDGEPTRPVGAVWVSLRSGLIHLALPEGGVPASPELALSALLEFGLKWSKRLEGRPSRVEVQDAGLRDAVAEPLSRLSTATVLVADMPAVRDALRTFATEGSGGPPFPGMLETPEVTPDRLRAFADAAARFYDARPWNHLTNEDLIEVEGAHGARGMTHVSVLGNGGREFGLALFESRKAFERLLDAAADPRRQPDRANGVTFGSIADLPFADVDAWEDYELPVAGKRAYPLAADFRRDGSVRRPDADELTYIEALLRALTGTTEDELDSGRWRRRVETFDGPVEITLTLPYLLEAEAGLRSTASRDQGLFDAPGNAGGSGGDALERAQELAFDASDAEGRLQIKLVRQALAISPDCADAWMVLADSASTPELALAHCERAVAAGARAIGPERFAALAGEFWGLLETRPYMSARLALAQTLRSLGRDDEAIGHYRELLALNPNDNQGVRYLLLVALLDRNQNDEAGALLDEYAGDIQALWLYARMLWRFRTVGDTPRTRDALDGALQSNPHAVKFLLNPDSIPFERPPHIALGSNDEGAYVAEMLGDAFEVTAGAVSWLQAQTATRRTRARRSRPVRRRVRRR